MIGKRNLHPRVILLLVFMLSLFFLPLNSTDYCGDANKDGSVNILDVVEIINYKYKDGSEPMPAVICDVDQSGEIDILDVVYIINFKYKGGPAPDCLLFECASIKGDCLSRESKINRLDPNGSMTLEIDGHDLHIFHMDAYYNCCLDYNTSYSIMGNGINIFEFDAGYPCDCNCYFNLESIIEDIPTGQYFVTLFDLEGDTVGFESIEIVPEPELIDYSVGGCGTKARNDLEYILDNGTLIMNHYDAYFNCTNVFSIEFNLSEDTLRFYEISTGSGYATCMCYYEMSATVINIPTGSYVAEIYQKQYPNSDIELYDRREILLE